MTVYTATDTASLLAVVGAVNAGDTILLAAGTYSGVTISNFAVAGSVTITSADPNNPALFTDLMVKNSQGLNISGVEMYANTDTPFQILNSTNIVLDSISMHGGYNAATASNYRGLLVRGSSNVAVTDSHFYQLSDAFTHSYDQGLTVTGNVFDSLQDNGVVGGGTSQLTISNNVFKDFLHPATDPVHPDAIQLWTTNTNVVASNITISGNVIDRGIGVPIQGIFLQDNTGALPYQHVVIANNVVVGEAYNGIYVTGGADVAMTGNTVISDVDQNSWIGTDHVAAVTYSGNIVGSIANSASGVTQSGDILSTPMAMANAATVSGALNGLAVPGQLDTIAAQYRALVLSYINQPGYIDGPPANGPAQTFLMQSLYALPSGSTLRVPAIGNYHLYGDVGNDTLVGGSRGGVNILEGGGGNNAYAVYQSSDVVIQSPSGGQNVLYAYADYTLPDNVQSIRAMVGGLTITGNAQNGGILTAAPGGTTLIAGSGNETLIGSTGADHLIGGAGTDRLVAGSGNNQTLVAGSGNTTIVGGSGTNILAGGAGNDVITVGSGLTTASGGGGVDSFTFKPTMVRGVSGAKDTITDFSISQDKINLSAFNSTIAGSTKRFSFIGSQAFHHVAGELHYVASGNGIDIQGDTTGDGKADFVIHLNGLHAITQSSFIY